MTSVFLSYARSDDEPFVARVYNLLRAHGFAVWWDRRNMPARGLTFTEEIRDAIHASDRVVVVIGPGALRSDYVRAEWQAALSERKPVVTAIRLVPPGTTQPHACLPPELKWFHAELFLVKDKIEPALDPLVRLLSEPIPPAPPIYGRPPERPPHYLPRVDAFSRLFAEVLGETLGPTVRTHESRVTLMTGMGGIGKSVLAWSLVEALRSRPTLLFADGIYWLAGDALRRLAALCHARVADPADDRDLSDALAEQLEGKRFLLVVDNATSAQQIAALARVLGSGGRMLVTTRHGELAVGHRHLPVDQLSEEEAQRLVADWLGTQPQALPLEARRVIERCGYHPFAIALNAAAASQGLPWSAILTALEQRDLAYAKHEFEEYVYETVEASIRISLDVLPKADRTRYLELAAFFWEGGVPAVAILRLWKKRSRLAEHHGLRLLVFLRQRSLLQLHGEPALYDVRLHDLHVMHIARDDKKAIALGRALLDAYQPSEEDWWRVPDDGYLHRCLVRHLLRSRPARDALALISAEEDGENAWYRARVHGGGSTGSREDGFAGYVADLAQVSGQTADCLLILIAASLRSLARTVPAALLDLAVADGGWSLQRAIARARLVVEPEKRARAMIALLSRVAEREQWLEETLDAIARAHVTERRDLMQTLAPALEEEELLALLRRVVAWAQAAATPYDKNHSKPLVWPLLNRMPASLASQAMAITDAIGIRPLRLYGLLEERERSARISEALAAYRDRDDVVSVVVHAETVAVLADHLLPTVRAVAVADAQRRVRQLEPGALRNRALASLLRHLPTGEQRDTMRELVDHARAKPDQFTVLARHAPAAYHADIRRAVEDQRLERMAAVAPLLCGEHRRALMDVVLTRIEASERAASLLSMDDAELLLAMNDAELERATKIIDAQLEGDTRVAALTAVARTGSDSQRARTLQDVLVAIDALGDSEQRERAYERVASLLSPAQVSVVLSAAERIGEPSGLAQLVKLLPHLSAPERRRATELVADNARRNGIVQCHRALLGLPRGCDIGNGDALIELALELDTRHGRAHVLAALAPRVNSRRRKQVAADARASIREHEQAGTRVELLLEIGAVREAERELRGAESAMDSDQFAKAVATLAKHLDAARASTWVNAVLDRGGRGKYVLETLAPYLSGEAALAYLAEQIRPEQAADRVHLWQVKSPDLPFVSVDEPATTAGALARRLGPLGMAAPAFELVRLGRDDEITASALVGLALWLPCTEVLEVERRMASAELGRMSAPLSIGRQGVGRDYLAARLAPALARAGEIERALRYAALADEAWRIDSYLGIAAATSGETRMRTLLRTLDVMLGQREVWRNEQIDAVAHAIASEQPACARRAWSQASEWARGQPRKDAIEVLAPMAPVAAAAGGTNLTNEVFLAIERAVRWWP